MKNVFSKAIFRLIFLCLVLQSCLFAICNCPPPPPDCPVQSTMPCKVPTLKSYINRFTVIGANGAMTFIGNTLGLSKDPCLNQPGTSDAIGAFLTTDPTQMVGTFPSIPAMMTGGPAGTTLDWHLNGSSAVLTLPPGITILYAELVWSGSYGYYCSTPQMGPGIGVDPDCILAFADGPISFTTADGQVHMVTADPATAQNSQNPAADVKPFYCAGNYIRSQNVTALFSATSLNNPNGTYTVSGVPATISQFDETHNAAGWTLAIVYVDPAETDVDNMSVFVAAQQASNPLSDAATVSGFCTPPAPPMQTARILVSAIEGDAGKTGDSMRFASTIPGLTLPASILSGPNNAPTNFFASQINDDLGVLITTTGTYCTVNQNPVVRTIPGARQGYDITNVAGQVTAGQTQAFTLATTSGDDYTINALGIDIIVLAPVIVPMKLVNAQHSDFSQIGETVTFTLTIDNTGNRDADNVVFTDLLETGLMLVPGTFKVDNVVIPNADLVAGVPLGSIPIGDTRAIEFEVMIIAAPLSDNMFVNFGTATFDFTPCAETQHVSNNSNLVTIIIPNPIIPPPSDFNGVVKKCEFLNKTKPTLKATWIPAPLPNVVSYRIRKDGRVVATIPASGPYIFEACLQSKKEATKFSIVAVYPGNIESEPLNIKITDE